MRENKASVAENRHLTEQNDQLKRCLDEFKEHMDDAVDQNRVMKGDAKVQRIYMSLRAIFKAYSRRETEQYLRDLRRHFNHWHL